MKTLITIIVIVILGFIVFTFFGGDVNAPSEAELGNGTSQPADNVESPEYVLSGTLADVTNGEEVRGVRTVSTTSGFVQVGFIGDTFVMDATFTDLPEPQNDDFYEGWLVRRGEDMSVVSTGKLENEGNGAYSNRFTSSVNLTDHDFYVLTLEPNDGDPAPADHILDGELN